jgi:hypothetical protein
MTFKTHSALVSFLGGLLVAALSGTGFHEARAQQVSPPLAGPIEVLATPYLSGYRGPRLACDRPTLEYPVFRTQLVLAM